MAVEILTGNIFRSDCQTLVNTINCVGVMGAGLALECRLRYPQMHDRYVDLCADHRIDIGLLWIYKANGRWILNFPTKKHWRYPAQEAYLHAGLQKFSDTYEEKGIVSIAFPMLGADKGGIPQQRSLDIMMGYLEKLDLKVEIYRYDPSAPDDLYDAVAQKLRQSDPEDIAKSTKLRIDYVEKVVAAIDSKSVCQLNQLARVKGVGIKTLEKIFNYAQAMPEGGAAEVPDRKDVLT